MGETKNRSFKKNAMFKRNLKYVALFGTAVLITAGIMLFAGAPLAAYDNPVPGTPNPLKHPSSTSLQPEGYVTKNGLGKGKLLVAGRSLVDPNFSQTVILLLDYSPKGAMGLVINQPSKAKLADLLPDVKGLNQRRDTLYIGGPVMQNQLMLLVKTVNQPKDALHIFEDVFVSSSSEVIQRMIGRPDTNERFRIYAGYAGWAAGQLDHEVAGGFWHIFAADVKTVFDTPSANIWPTFIRRSSSTFVKAKEGY